MNYVLGCSTISECVMMGEDNLKLTTGLRKLTSEQLISGKQNFAATVITLLKQTFAASEPEGCK